MNRSTFNMTPVIEGFVSAVGEITAYEIRTDGTETKAGSTDLFYAPNISTAIGEAYYTTEPNEQGIGYDQWLVSQGTANWYISKVYNQNKPSEYAVPVDNESKPMIGRFWNPGNPFKVTSDQGQTVLFDVKYGYSYGDPPE